MFRPPSTSPPPSPCSSSSSCSHSSPVSFHFRLLVPFSTSSPLTRRCRRFRLDFDVAQELPISGNWLRRHGGLDECSIQSFHFFSFPWEQLLLFPSSLLFPSFILFMRFPFPFFSPRRRRFETTRCHCAKRSLKEDEGIEFATVSFAIQFFMRILRNVYRRGKCVCKYKIIAIISRASNRMDGLIEMLSGGGQWSRKNGGIDRERDSARKRSRRNSSLGSYTLAYSPSTFIPPPLSPPPLTFGIEF